VKVEPCASSVAVFPFCNEKNRLADDSYVGVAAWFRAMLPATDRRTATAAARHRRLRTSRYSCTVILLPVGVGRRSAAR
jgi:hypothetical protein